MRHRKTGRKLGRQSAHRKALMANMATSLFRHERIQTTDAKAKELRPFAEKLITLGKRGDLHARRRVLRVIPDQEVVEKLFTDIADRNRERAGGYTRIYKVSFRKGDNAPISAIELVARNEQAPAAVEEISKDEVGKDEISKDD